MKIAIFFFFILFSFSSWSQWRKIDSGINDDFTSVIQSDSSVFLTGKKGFYLNTESAFKKAAWKRFEAVNNLELATIYNQTSFTSCLLEKDFTTNKIVIACGQDTVNKLARVFLFNIQTNTCELVYTGPANSKLNDIGIHYNSNKYDIIGNDGLYVVFDYANGKTITLKDTGYKFNFKSLFTDPSSSITYIATQYGILTVNYQSTDYKFSLNSLLSNANAVEFHSFNYTSKLQKVYGSGFNCDGEIVTNYNYGALNANVCSNGFVGTDHGIFVPTSNYILEWMPSSKKYNILGLSCENVNLKYACGANGVLLSQKTSEPSMPFLKVLTNGSCIGKSTINSYSNSNIKSQWFLNDSLIGNFSYTSGFGITFKKLGKFKLKVIASNNKYSDTIIKDFNIVAIPKVNQKITSDVNVLCHQGYINVSIPTSEKEVYYNLKRYEPNPYTSLLQEVNYGSSTEGNENTITFKSDKIVKSSSFVLFATSTLADCSAKFIDSIKVKVEQTKSAFSYDKVNAHIGENVQFYQHSKDASTFKWIINDNNQQIVKTGASVIHSFNSNESKVITLISISDNNCTDTLTQKGVNIIPKTARSSWSISNLLPHSSVYLPVIRKVKDGIIYVSDSLNHDIKGVAGDSLLSNNKSHFMVKYDKNGILKWCVKANTIQKTTVDKQGNIYIVVGEVGRYLSNYFVDNTGDSILFKGGNTLFKLDSLGKVIWKVSSQNYNFRRIDIDNSQNIYSFGTIDNVYKYAVLFRNNVKIDSLYYTATENNHLVLKMNANGYVSWYTYYNGFEINQVCIDKKNNVYYSIKKNYSAYKIEYLSTDFTTYSNQNVSDLYVLKCDSNGVFQWCNIAYLTSANKSISISDITVDDLGQVYICGKIRNFANSDNTFFSIKKNNVYYVVKYKQSGVYIVKLSSDGVARWVRGSKAYQIESTPNMSLVDNQVMLYGISYKDLLFVNQDSTKYIDTTSNFKFYIAYFDTAANLNKIYTSNTDGIYFSNSYNPVYFDNNEYFASFSNTEVYKSPFPTVFGTTFDKNIGKYCATVFKFSTADINKNLKYPKYIVTIRDTICNNSMYKFPTGVKKVSSKDFYLDTFALKSSKNLDSLIIFRIKTQTLSDSLIQTNDSTLVAFEKNATSYKWLNCNDGYKSVDAFENKVKFEPTITGNYALRIQNKFCVDTTTCLPITLTAKTNSLSDEIWEHSIHLFPNPTNGNVMLSFDKQQAEVEISLLDVYGKLIKKNNFSNMSVLNYPMEESEGIYFIQVKDKSNHIATLKIIKK